MKIRIKGNAIRFRLTQSEVNYFSENGQLQEKTEFGNGELKYAIISSINHETLSVEWANNTILLNIPAMVANNWTTTNLVGLEARQPLGNGKELFLLIEKDFKCLDATTEDQSDNYPNPLAEKHQNG